MTEKREGAKHEFFDLRGVTDTLLLLRRARLATRHLELSINDLVVLQALHDGPGLSLSHALRHLPVTATEATAVTTKLERRGLIDRTRRSEGEDRRTVACTLTSKGKRLLEDLATLPLEPSRETD